jgi:hypothetical protein
MAALITVLALLLLAVVVMVVSAPLRDAARRDVAGEGEEGAPAGDERGVEDAAAERERLEAAREAKYREIRDAELDYRTGKLSEADYRRLDADLRAEALEILDSLEAAGVRPTDA